MKLNLSALALQFISLFCLVLVVMLIVQNWSTPVALVLGQSKWASVSLGSVLVVVSILVAVSLLLRVSQSVKGLQDTLLRHEMKRTQAQASSEASQDTVQALEAKVETLETALEKALSARSGLV